MVHTRINQKLIEKVGEIMAYEHSRFSQEITLARRVLNGGSDFLYYPSSFMPRIPSKEEWEANFPEKPPEPKNYISNWELERYKKLEQEVIFLTNEKEQMAVEIKSLKNVIATIGSRLGIKNLTRFDLPGCAGIFIAIDRLALKVPSFPRRSGLQGLDLRRRE